ncbi:hypothetical protein [Biformimicrobium ophioploci]|uniref:hypothetical protein n=1 Tax=Biformimicrobium ophioploci TaxID=3036711 RepID=UPI0025562330|nr:hypothetical protein [Microbulbifer sp. NKW57]
MKRALRFISLMLIASCAFGQAVSREEIYGLDEQIQSAKQDVIELTSELALLEEKLLFPSSTQAAFFVSVPSGSEFDLQAVELSLDGKVVSHHLYTFRELESLRKGGVQKIHLANLEPGHHPLHVRLIGESAAGKELRVNAGFTVEKQTGPAFVEIELAGDQSAINFKVR